MQARALLELVAQIQAFHCEMQTIEVKAAHNGCPQRLYDTLSSFSNQDSGGIIIFGLDEKENFKTVGVYDPQDLQKHITEQCNEMVPHVRALFSVVEIDGMIVVSAEIPSVDISERPVFYSGKGRLTGSYIRVGDADERMSEYEIYSYDAFRKRIRDDLRPVSGGRKTLLDADRLKEYVQTVRTESEKLSAHVNDEELLELMGVTVDGVPTIAGVMVFSIYPQGYFPQLCITAIRVPGREIGETGGDHERFIDNRRITGPIHEMVEEAVNFVRRNSRIKTIINAEGKRCDKEEYPLKAVREAVLNAVIHRDYSIHSENVPVRIEMFEDRMEIINSGGLYGRISIDSLGKVHPETRNAALANMLEVLDVTENRYSGIPTIRGEFQAAGLPAPIFAVRRGEFIVTFKNGLYQAELSGKNAQHTDDILDFCAIPRTRDELQQFTGFSRYYTMTHIVKPLLEQGLLKMTIPEKPKSPSQRFVKA